MATFVQNSPPTLLESYLSRKKLEVRLSSLHDDGVNAREFIHTGDTIFAEKPLCFLQTIPNAQEVIICGECQTVLGALDVQVGLLSKTISREDVPSTAEICHCRAKCGLLYCSDGCHDKHWNRGHKLLCTGSITDEEASCSPLINFKIHACATNEIFLLVADVFANICCEIEQKREEGNMDDLSILTVALHPYNRFVRNLWWDVAIPSAKEQTDDSGESPEAFASTLRQLVSESWDMLRQVLDLDGRGLTEVLSIEYMARTIGMFEQNNIGVRCEHPLAVVSTSLEPHGAMVTPLLAAVEKISQYLEEHESSDDEWEDAGSDDNDDDDVDDSDDMNNCEHSSECHMEHHHHGQEEMDVAETGDASLDKLKTVLHEYGVDGIFTPLDGTALFSMLCKINHSCDPNVRVKYVFTREYGMVARLVALKDIKPDEELLQSYIDQSMGTDARQAALADYGFRCSCSKCIP